MFSGAKLDHVALLGIHLLDNAPGTLKRLEKRMRSVASPDRRSAILISDVKKPILVFKLANLFDQHNFAQTTERHIIPLPERGYRRSADMRVNKLVSAATNISANDMKSCVKPNINGGAA